jgi:hypothetical protein
MAAMLLAFGTGSCSLAQTPAYSMSGSDTQQPTSTLSESELDNLVAPIALYPDALLSQVLVASTYPLEVVEAQQWLQQNGNLRDRELMAAAQQQNWDPSLQALVAFPDVVALLTRDIRWTTDLGNAFLSQQSDVMNAVQTLRAEAQGNGRLAATPQFAVNTEIQGEQSAIEIQPMDPQRMYVPNYDPHAVWGAPAEGDYPELPYAQGSGFDSVFGTVANLAGLLPGFGGLLGPRSWGWALGWLTQALFVNNSFFSDFGFHNYDGGFRGSSVWVHNAHHRLGVPYGNNSLVGWRGRGNGRGDEAQRGERWSRFGGEAQGTRAGGRRPFAPYRTTSGEGYRRDTFPRDNRIERDGNWRRFNGNTRTGQSGRTLPQPLRTTDRRFTHSRSFGSGSNYKSNYDGFGKFGTARRPEPSRALASSRSWRDAPRFSAARMGSEHRSSFERGSSSRSRHESSWKHGFSSHASRPKAPKYSAPHFSKSHGGGHSSKGHSGKRSHRG